MNIVALSLALLMCGTAKASGANERSGVGDTTIDRIRCRQLDCKKDGVGNVSLKNVDCEVLSLKNRGLGRMTVGGKADKVTMEDSARGGLDTGSLTIKNK